MHLTSMHKRFSLSIFISEITFIGYFWSSSASPMAILPTHHVLASYFLLSLLIPCILTNLTSILFFFLVYIYDITRVQLSIWLSEFFLIKYILSCYRDIYYDICKLNLTGMKYEVIDQRRIKIHYLYLERMIGEDKYTIRCNWL